MLQVRKHITELTKSHRSDVVTRAQWLAQQSVKIVVTEVIQAVELRKSYNYGHEAY